MKMFKTLGLLGVLALAGYAGAADGARYLRVNVPFAFVVAGQTLSPGNYNVTETETGVITIQGGGKAAAVISTPGEISKPGEASALRFTNNNNRTYLVGVSMEGEGTRAIPEHFSAGRNIALAVR